MANNPTMPMNTLMAPQRASMEISISEVVEMQIGTGTLRSQGYTGDRKDIYNSDNYGMLMVWKSFALMLIRVWRGLLIDALKPRAFFLSQLGKAAPHQQRTKWLHTLKIDLQKVRQGGPSELYVGRNVDFCLQMRVTKLGGAESI